VIVLLIETISMRYRHPAHGHAFAAAACRLRAHRRLAQNLVVIFAGDPS